MLPKRGSLSATRLASLFASVALLALVFLPGCAAGDDPTVDGRDQNGTDGTGGDDGAKGDGGGGDGGDRGGDGGGSGDGSRDQAGRSAGDVDASLDDGPPGAAGRYLLSPTVRGVVLELAQAGSARLSDTALDALEGHLVEHGGKSVTRSTTSGLPVKDVYTADDLRAIEAEYRKQRSGDAAVAVMVLVLPGRFEQEGVLGVAFLSTTFAVFPEHTARRLPPLANVDAYEAAVASHELGHLFGLVNLTGEGAFHEDPDHPRHSNERESVMHWAVESANIAEVFTTGPPTTFTDADRREMEAIRTVGG